MRVKIVSGRMTDREIVLALAEKVMGWTVYPRDEFGDYRATTRDGSEMLIWTEDHDWVIGERHWNPLDKIADAWMLVEKIMACHADCLAVSHPSGNTNLWQASFTTASSPKPAAGVKASSPAAARAICLAAHRALNSEEKPFKERTCPAE